MASLTSVSASPRRRARGVVGEAIELQIDLEPMAPLGQMLDEGGVVRDSDTVGVDHHHVDRLLAGVVDDRGDIGMDGRLAAGELQDFRPAFNRHEPIDRRARPRPAKGAGRRGRCVHSKAGTRGCRPK